MDGWIVGKPLIQKSEDPLIQKTIIRAFSSAGIFGEEVRLKLLKGKYASTSRSF
jgi:hypothetical protein